MIRDLILLGALVGCSTPAPTEAPDHGEHGEHAKHGEHGKHGKHANPYKPPADAHVHGHGHGDGATVTHRFQDADKWAKVFDDPERDAWQKPAELVAALKLEPGQAVADIGAGTGYLGPHLARAVGPDGTVILADVEASLVAHMTERFADTPQVSPRTIPMDAPGLKPDEVDVVVLLDVVHHIGGRVAWFTALKDAVKPGGRVVIVDFKAGELPVGPPPEHRLPAAQVQQELEQAGWTLVDSPDVLPHQFVQVYQEG